MKIAYRAIHSADHRYACLRLAAKPRMREGEGM
jgi:hypothetical protein